MRPPSSFSAAITRYLLLVCSTLCDFFAGFSIWLVEVGENQNEESIRQSSQTSCYTSLHSASPLRFLRIQEIREKNSPLYYDNLALQPERLIEETSRSLSAGIRTGLLYSQDSSELASTNG